MFTQPSWMLMRSTELKNSLDFGLTILSLDTGTLTGATKLINSVAKLTVNMDNNTTTGSNPIPCQKEETPSQQEPMILTNSGMALHVMILVEIIKITIKEASSTITITTQEQACGRGLESGSHQLIGMLWPLTFSWLGATSRFLLLEYLLSLLSLSAFI